MEFASQYDDTALYVGAKIRRDMRRTAGTARRRDSTSRPSSGSGSTRSSTYARPSRFGLTAAGPWNRFPDDRRRHFDSGSIPSWMRARRPCSGWSAELGSRSRTPFQRQTIVCGLNISAFVRLSRRRLLVLVPGTQSECSFHDLASSLHSASGQAADRAPPYVPCARCRDRDPESVR